jgi:hypothetical protein
MAVKLKSLEDWAELDRFRMETAIREIARSDSLRFFLRSVLATTGVTGTPSGPDAHSMALNVGRHSVGSDLIATLMAYDPQLYGKLLVEDADEGDNRSELTKETLDEIG